MRYLFAEATIWVPRYKLIQQNTRAQNLIDALNAMQSDVDSLSGTDFLAGRYVSAYNQALQRARNVRTSTQYYYHSSIQMSQHAYNVNNELLNGADSRKQQVEVGISAAKRAAQNAHGAAGAIQDAVKDTIHTGGKAGAAAGQALGGAAETVQDVLGSPGAMGAAVLLGLVVLVVLR